MPPAQENNSYLNFLSTHDGIGMRPVEGILPEMEVKKYFRFFKNRVDYFLTEPIKVKNQYMK